MKLSTERADEKRAVPGRGQHVVRSGNVVAHGLGRVGAQEDGPRIANVAHDVHGAIRHQFKMFGGDAVC